MSPGSSGRWIATCLAVLAATGCPTALPRVAKPVTVAEARTLCSLDDVDGVSGKEALCIARLAGLDVRPGRAILRDDHALDGTPVWTVRETCDGENPYCLEIVMSADDGRIVNERRLYLRLSRRGS